MCPSILRREAAATTISFTQVAFPDIGSREKAEFHHLHMAWVLVADRKGDPWPHMRWLVD